MSSDTNRQRLLNCQQDQSNGNPSKPSDIRDRQKTSRKDQKRNDNFRRFASEEYTRSFPQSAADRKSFTAPNRQVPQYTPPAHLTGAYRDALFEGPRRMSKDYMPLYRTTYKRFFSEMDTAQRMKCIASRAAQNTVNLTTSGQTTVESISDSVKSLQTTEQSDSDSVNSLQTTEEPVSDSVKSLQTTEEPVSDNMKSVQTREQSVSDSVQSVQTTEQSVSDSVKSVHTTEQSVSDSVQSVQTTEQSVSDSVKSVHTTEQSVSDSVKSVQTTEQSVSDSVQSVQTTEQSVSNSLKSVHTTEQSVSDNMKFVQTIVESVSERTKPGRQSFCSRVMTDGEEMNSMIYADSNSIHNDAGRNAQLRYPEMSKYFRKEAVKRLVTIIELTIKENVHELAMITGCSIQMVDLFRELTGQTVGDLLHNESVIVQTILLSVNTIDDSEKSQSRASAVYRAFDWLYECAIALVSRKKMSYLSGRRDALSQTVIDRLPELLQITLNRVIRHLFYSRRVPSHVYQSKGRKQHSEEILTQLDTIIASFPAADSYSILTKRFSNQDKEDASSSNEGETAPRLFNNDHGTTPHAKNSMTEMIPRNMSKWTFHFISNANNRLPPSLSFPLKIKDHSFSNIAESNIPVTAPLSFTNIHEPTLRSYDKAPKTVPRSCSYEHEVSVPSYSKASETTSQSFSNTGSARPYSCAISHESEPHTCRNILDTTLYAFNKAPVITQQSCSTLPQSVLNSHYESHQSLPQSVSCRYEDAPSSVSNTIEKGHTSVRKSLQTVSYSSNNTQTNKSSPLCDTFATAASIVSGTKETKPSLFDVLPTDECPTLPRVKPEKYSHESAKESNFVVKNVTSISEDDFARMLTIHGGKANKLDATEFSKWQQTTDVVGHAKIKIEPRDEVSDFQHDINECSVQVKENPCSYNMPFMSKHLYANESFLLKSDSQLESSTELNVVSDDQGKITNPDYEVMYPQLTSILNEDDAVTDTSRKSTMLQVELETRIKGLDVNDFENTDAWSKNRTLRSVIAVADQNVSPRVDSGLNRGEYLRTKFNKSDVGSLVGLNPHKSSRRDVNVFPVPCNSNATYTYAMKRPTTAGTLGICQGTQGISCGENGSLDPKFQETKEADATLSPLFNRGSRYKTRQRYRRLRRKAETREYRSVDIVATSNEVVETTRKTFGKSTGNSKCSNAERKEMVDGNGEPKRHRDRNVMKRATEKILSTYKTGRNTSRAKGSEDGRIRQCDEQNLLSVKWRTNDGLVIASDIKERKHAFPSKGKDDVKNSFAENEYRSRESKCHEGRNWTKEPKRGKCKGENGDSVPKIYERGNVCEDIENPALTKPERGKTNDDTTESVLKKPERGKTNDDTTESVLKKPERGKTNDDTTESVLKKKRRGEIIEDNGESVLKEYEMGKSHKDYEEPASKELRRENPNEDTGKSVLGTYERGRTTEYNGESILAWLEGLCTAIEDINEPIQVSQGPTHAEIDRSDQLYSIISHDNDILSITTGQDSVFSEHKDCLNAVVYETHQTEEQQEENQKAIKQEVLCTTHAMNTEAPLLSPVGELQTDDNEDKTIHEIPDLFAETDLTPEYTLCSNYKQKQIDEMSFEGDKAKSNASTLINLESTSNDSKQVSKMPEQEDVDEEKRIMQSLYRDSMMAKNESFSHMDQRRTNVWEFSQPDENGSQVGLMANKNVIVEMKGTGMEPNFNALENGHEGFSDGSIYDVNHEECSKTSDFKITRKIEGDGCYVNSENTSGIKRETGFNVSIQDEILLDIQNLFLSAFDMTEKLMDCSKEKSNNSKVVSENYKNGDYSSREQSLATMNFSFQNSFIKEVSSVGVSSDEVTEGGDIGARLMSDVSGHGCEVGHDTTEVLAEDAVPDKLEELQVFIKFYQLRKQIHICEEKIAVG